MHEIDTFLHKLKPYSFSIIPAEVLVEALIPVLITLQNQGRKKSIVSNEGLVSSIIEKLETRLPKNLFWKIIEKVESFHVIFRANPNHSPSIAQSPAVMAFNALTKAYQRQYGHPFSELMHGDKPTRDMITNILAGTIATDKLKEGVSISALLNPKTYATSYTTESGLRFVLQSLFVAGNASGDDMANLLNQALNEDYHFKSMGDYEAMDRFITLTPYLGINTGYRSWLKENPLAIARAQQSAFTTPDKAEDIPPTLLDWASLDKKNCQATSRSLLMAAIRYNPEIEQIIHFTKEQCEKHNLTLSDDIVTPEVFAGIINMEASRKNAPEPNNVTENIRVLTKALKLNPFDITYNVTSEYGAFIVSQLQADYLKEAVHDKTGKPKPSRTNQPGSFIM